MIDWIVFIFIGLLAGLLSGLLGVGGGIIIVPGLSEWIAYRGFETTHVMQISIGTSLSCIMVISCISALTHKKMGTIRWDLVRLLAPGTVFGALVGVQIADLLPSPILKDIFAVILALIALQMIIFKAKSQRDIPYFKPWLLMLSGLLIGIMSGLIGLGGGLLIVPLLLFNGIPMVQCSSTALWCTLPTVTVGAAMAVWTGYNETDLLPNCFGYVYWPATLAICLVALVSAPIGVRLAHKLPKALIKSLLISILSIIVIRLAFT